MQLFNSAVGIIIIALCGIVFGFEDTVEYNGLTVFQLQPKEQYHNGRIVEFPRNMGFQIGGLIISPDKDIKHEYGHYEQEKKLGILYLPIVGTCSLLGNTLFRKSYGEIWTEKWADDLGGIEWH